MELLGSHKVSFASVRALAIQCHALDLSAYDLLFTSTQVDKDEKTKNAYEEQFTSQLLTLAIALRTKFYQGYDHRSTISYVSHCGLLYKYGKNAEATEHFSIKDVCDKIIHANKVKKYLEAGIEKPTTSLCGKAQDGSLWELSMSVSLFAEAVLNWVRDVEETTLRSTRAGRAG